MSRQYYSLTDILKNNTQYYMIFGERSNGKSYAVLKKFADDFFLKGHEFIIMKRYAEDMKKTVCETVFTPLADYIAQEYNHEVYFYGGKWYARPMGEDKPLSQCDTMGYAMSISQSDRYKMGQYLKVTNICLEEFMSQSSIYLPDEVRLFINIISTVTRDRTNIKVFLLGNAITKSSPYSSALGIKLHRMKKGEIVQRRFEDGKGHSTTFTIQRTANVEIVEDNEGQKITYAVWGANGKYSKMITSGDFETSAYYREANGVTFHECLKELPPDKYHILNKDDYLKIAIRYEDYYYKIYRYNGVYGFRESQLHEITPKNTRFIINNNETIKGIKNIIDINSYNGGGINRVLDDLLHAIKQEQLVFINDDNGEDVISALRQSNVNIKKR